MTLTECIERYYPGGRSGENFTPRSFSTLQSCEEEARTFAGLTGGGCICLDKGNGEYTFAPTSGDAISMASFVAKCFGGKVASNNFVLSL